MIERLDVSPEISSPFFDTIGNHEVKIAASGLLLELREPFTWSSFISLFEEKLQGRLKVHSKSLISLCKRSLTAENGIITAEPEGLQVVPEHRVERMVLIGFLSEWSIRWRDFSVQQIYGTAGRLRPDDPSLAWRAPAIRQAIYMSVYEHEVAKKTVSIPEICQITGINPDTVTRHIRRLEDVRILHKESISEADYVVRIGDYDFPLKPPGNSSQEAHAFYAAVNHLGCGLTSVRKLVETAKALRPDLDVAKLNLLIRGRLRQGGPKGVELITNREKGMHKQTSIRFTDEARQAMHELLGGITSLHKGERLIWYAARGVRAIRNKAVFRFLVAKGLAYPYRSSHDPLEQQAIRQEILAMTSSHPEGLTVKMTQMILDSTRPNHVWTTPAVRAYLGELVGSGQLDLKKQQKSPYAKNPVNTYHLAETGKFTLSDDPVSEK